ncbi:MAG: NAD(P)/FAD-dependent oxidoreductase [Coriobacteriales bacterium]|jgi:2,4-dienoyl-CoA reductase-like NADH-dependent reductase (Old Yellow Enzyme family)/thioredoxin reductase|nr:NAD(P)/FAD-dependent oxidoreductase [Coriobacteriales bacterium]
MGSAYKRVFEPKTIKGVTYKNRIFCTPHVWGWGSREGIVTPEMEASYERIASGGPALVTMGNVAINMQECSDEIHQLDMSDDKVIFGLSNMRRRMERYGCVLSAQLNYCGRNAHWPGSTMYAPSPITGPGILERADAAGTHPEMIVHELTREHIYRIIGWYADAAERLKKAGMVHLMLHYAHNNLVGQFFSPISNFRDDEYGPMSLETRTRFGREVLEAVRRRVGNDMIIDLRFSGEDVMPGGLQRDEAVEIARMLKPWVDIYHISCAFHNPPSTIGDRTTLSYYSPEMTLLEYTRPFKEALADRAVVLTTSVLNIENAERALEEGVCDFVGMFRPFLADVDIVKKYARGHEEEVNQCIRCEYHWSFAPDYKPVPCAVNPICGHALEFPGDRLVPAAPPRRVLVVGSGPAGMQAALTASERGHEVSIVEMDDHLGGNLIKAANVPFKAEFKKYVNWIIPRVEKAAKVILNTRADAAFVENFAPDVLIIAAGAADNVPPVPGVRGANVHFAWQADDGSVPVGDSVVVIGAGLVGMESAIVQAEAGRKVTVVEMQTEAGATASKGMLATACVKRAERAGVKTLYRHAVRSIEADRVRIEDLASGALQELLCDTVLLAAGVRPRQEVVDELRHAIPECDVYLVGDLTMRPATENLSDGSGWSKAAGGTIGHATNTAFEVAVAI